MVFYISIIAWFCIHLSGDVYYTQLLYTSFGGCKLYSTCAFFAIVARFLRDYCTILNPYSTPYPSSMQAFSNSFALSTASSSVLKSPNCSSGPQSRSLCVTRHLFLTFLIIISLLADILVE